jgi:hypothetical protein
MVLPKGKKNHQEPLFLSDLVTVVTHHGFAGAPVFALDLQQRKSLVIKQRANRPLIK